MKKYTYNTSARRNPLTYLGLAFGLVFAYAGFAVDPATNCDESGRECAPWLVHVAFWMGILTTLGILITLFKDPTWGSHLDMTKRELTWWDYTHPQGQGCIALDEVSRVLVREVYDGADTIYFYDRSGALMPIPIEGVLPYALKPWARDLGQAFPHITIEIKEIP